MSNSHQGNFTDPFLRTDPDSLLLIFLVFAPLLLDFPFLSLSQATPVQIILKAIPKTKERVSFERELATRDIEKAIS